MAERTVEVKIDEEMGAVHCRLIADILVNGEWKKTITLPRNAGPYDVCNVLEAESFKALTKDGNLEMAEILLSAVDVVPG